MSKYVLDSFAILALLQQESGWERVRQLIQDATQGSAELYMSIINVAEVKYNIARRGRDKRQAFGAMDALPITVVSADESIDQVIELKAGHAVSLADCFAAAAAMQFDCPVVTGDPEFGKLEDVVRVEWLGDDRRPVQ